MRTKTRQARKTASTFAEILRRECALKSDECSGPLQRDHIGYDSVSQKKKFQTLCRYHNCKEARELRFFVANQVLRGKPLPGPVRFKLNFWHVQYRLHAELKIRIRALSAEHPLPKNFVPGEGQKFADKEIAAGRFKTFQWKPFLQDGFLRGFWVRHQGEEAELIK